VARVVPFATLKRQIKSIEAITILQLVVLSKELQAVVLSKA
jgi:hypothetical protein